MSERSHSLTLRGRPLLTDVLKLVSGTAGGRLILIAALPLVTRLYSPGDFTLLAVYLALVSTASVVACLRFDIAIPFATTQEDAVHLLALSLSSVLLVTLLSTVPALVLPETTAALLGNPALAPFLWLASLGIAVVGAYSALQFWATRARRFSSIAVTRITQACVGAGTMLGMGWAGLAPLGLLLGNMLALGAGGVRLALDAARRDGTVLRNVTIRGMRERARAYRRYPLFSTPEALANTAGVQVPIIFIAAHGGQEAGYLYLAMMVMLAPMVLLGQSVAQVFASRARDELLKGTLGTFTWSMMRRLALVGAPPIALAALVAPWLFPLVFGAEWERAGVIVAWIAPWMGLQFITSPVSLALHVTGNQLLAMVLQFAGFVLRTGAVVVATAVAPAYVVPAFAISSGIFYAVYAILVLRVASRR